MIAIESWTEGAVKEQTDQGRIPFVDCPGDELSPCGVERRHDGWVAVCGQCGGTMRVGDVRWMTPSEAIDRGWVVMMQEAPGSPGMVM